jgi:hypothetical protein
MGVKDWVCTDLTVSFEMEIFKISKSSPPIYFISVEQDWKVWPPRLLRTGRKLTCPPKTDPHVKLE